MKETGMSRTFYALIILVVALTAVVRSQSPPTDPKNSATSPAGPVGPQSNPNLIKDCACESQVLPQTLAIVNGVTITTKDIEKATSESVSQLQRQIIEARKRELDLTINSRLLEIEAKKRGVNTTKLLEQEVAARVKRPTPAEAQAFFDQNKARIKEEFKEVARSEEHTSELQSL